MEGLGMNRTLVDQGGPEWLPGGSLEELRLARLRHSRKPSHGVTDEYLAAIRAEGRADGIAVLQGCFPARPARGHVEKTGCPIQRTEEQGVGARAEDDRQTQGFARLSNS